MVWISLRSRCNNPKNKDYARYGGRGIYVCERWNSFEYFLEDMGEQPPGLTIERVNNDGPYAPWNCKWVTHKEQSQNQRKLSHDEASARVLLGKARRRERLMAGKVLGAPGEK